MGRPFRLSTARGLQFLALAVLFPHAHLFAGIIDFETFPDGTPIPDGTSITTQFPGLVFTNTTVITAGISLNEFEFPPNDGSNVAFDDGGPIRITFDTPALVVSGYFTYSESVTIIGFGTSDNVVVTASSAFSNNEALSGDSGSTPNEYLKVASQLGLSGLAITGDPSGASLTIDDLTVTSAPEPGSLTPLILILAIFYWVLRHSIYAL